LTLGGAAILRRRPSKPTARRPEARISTSVRVAGCGMQADAALAQANETHNADVKAAKEQHRQDVADAQTKLDGMLDLARFGHGGRWR